jgi:hypothetical protein
MQVPTRVRIGSMSFEHPEGSVRAAGQGFSSDIQRVKLTRALAPAMCSSETSFPIDRRWPRSVDSHPCDRKNSQGWGTGHSSAVICIALWLAVLLTASSVMAQDAAPATAVPVPIQAPITTPDPSAQAPQTPEGTAVTPRPIAIVPLDSKISGAAAEVTGGPTGPLPPAARPPWSLCPIEARCACALRQRSSWPPTTAPLPAKFPAC